MKDETRLIGVKPLLDDLKSLREALMGAGDPILASVISRAITIVEKQPVADAVCGYCPSCGATLGRIPGNDR